MEAAHLLLTLLVIALAVLSWRRFVRTAVVYSGMIGLLYRDGVYRRVLEPGFHRWFDPGGRTALRIAPANSVALHGHEFAVITKDQFSFRVTLTPVVRISEAKAYFDELGPAQPMLPQGMVHFPRLQAAMAATVLEQFSAITLDEFLANPLGGLGSIESGIVAATPGAEIEDLLVTAITMPPEIRKMFTEVERARRDGLAALERARGETASLRALANAARSLNANPQLAHLRTLQAMESTKGTKTFVLGAALPLQVPGSDTQHVVSE